ncbi:MAG: hypothetical protein JJU33_10780 [Phycisphaerales bacterium]|nr:hypothetical protein [Phycisphaerales bacterium]
MVCNMKTVLGSAAGLLVMAALSGCATQKSPTPWESAFSPMSEVGTDATDQVTIRQVDYERAESNPRLPGHEIIGRSAFRDERSAAGDLSAGSRLGDFARSVGASMVVVGERSAGQEERVRYIRTAGVGVDTGDAISRGTPPARQTGSEPVPVLVDVYDYIAVFYRRVD